MTMALEGGEGSVSRPGRSLPPGKTRYPLHRRLGGPQGWSGQVLKISPPSGIWSLDCPARSQSLYWLHYPAHYCCMTHCKIIPYFVTVIQWNPHLQFLWGTVDLNSKHRTFLDGGNVTLTLWMWDLCTLFFILSNQSYMWLWLRPKASIVQYAAYIH